MIKIIRAACVAALSLSLSAPSQAIETYGDRLDARVNDVYAGAYLTYRFGGPKKARSTDQLKYGFRAGLQAPNRGYWPTQSYNLTGRLVQGQKRINLTFLDTSFDGQGFDKLSLAGAPLLFRGDDGEIYVLRADGAEGEGKEGSVLKTAGKVVLWTGVVIVGVFAAVSLASCADGESKEEAFLDFCPLN